MSTGYSYGSNIGYAGAGAPYATYGGYGQYAQRTPIPAEFARRLLLPNVSPVFLITATARISLNNGEIAQSAFRFTTPARVIAVLTNNGKESLDEVFTVGDVFSTTGTYYQEAGSMAGSWTLYISRFNPGFDPIPNEFIAVIEFNFSTRPKTFRATHWQPRVKTMPALSFRIEPRFSGPGQVGGGKITLNNEDGFFDQLDESNVFTLSQGAIYWAGGSVTLEMGLDLANDPAGVMAESDYRVIGTWVVESTDKSDDEFTLAVRERKNNLELEIPFEQYRREDFTTLEDATVGQPIPRAYGRHFSIRPTLIDANTRTFKVAHHPIRSFDGVKIQNSLDETLDVVVTGWTLYSGAAYQFAETREVVNVQFNGADLVEAKSPEKVISTQGTWHYRDGIVFVRPSTGETITSGTYETAVRTRLTVWQVANFATVDPQNATFTLGEDWDRSAAVAVDFSGRVNQDGTLMENAADVVADLLDYAGEIQLDAESFAASRRILRTGVNRWGEEVTHLAVALYLDEKKAVRDTIAAICEAVGASFFVDFDGLWRFVVFNPVRGATLDYAKDGLLRTFTEKQILGPVAKNSDARAVFSKVTVHFNPRVEEKWDQSLVVERPLNQYVHNLPDLALVEREPALFRRADTRYFGQRLLTTEGEELVKYSFHLPLAAFFLLPTERIHVTHTRYQLDAVLEVIEATYDLTRSQVKVVAGNQRAWGDSFGFWVADRVAAVTPTVPVDAECWLRADAMPLSHLDRVAQWNDVSGRNRHAFQYAAATQPFFHTNQINGLPAIRFGLAAASTPYNLLLPTAGMSAWTEAEGFLIVKADVDPRVVTGTNSLWALGASGTLEGSDYPDTSGNIQEPFFSSATKNVGNPAPALTGWRLYNVSSKANEFTVRLDGTQIFQTLVNTFAAYGSSNTYFGSTQVKAFNGWFAEFILFKRILTTAERASVLQYLSDKYALGLVAASAIIEDWDNTWTDAQAHAARQNQGYWQSPTDYAHNLDVNRSYRAGRWW